MYKREWGKNILEKFSKEDFEQMYKENSVTDLAKKLKVSRQTVVSMAKKYGLPQKPKGGEVRKHKTIKIDVKELERLYRTMTTQDLAKKLRVSVTTLVKIVKENGIELKKQGYGVRFRKVIVEGANV